MGREYRYSIDDMENEMNQHTHTFKASLEEKTKLRQARSPFTPPTDRSNSAWAMGCVSSVYPFSVRNESGKPTGQTT